MSKPIKNVFTFFIIIFGFQLYGQSPIQDQEGDPAYLQSISYYESGRYQAALTGFNHYLKTGKTSSFLVGVTFLFGTDGTRGQSKCSANDSIH